MVSDPDEQGRGRRVLEIAPDDPVLLQACVGFHAKALSDPSVRDRLYRLWCTLDRAASVFDEQLTGPTGACASGGSDQAGTSGSSAPRIACCTA